MTEDNKENINDINIEQKPIEAFKDNIKKENISDIKIKNQSLQNNTNSYSKSFDSEKNDNKEKEFITNNINNDKKESKFKSKKEEIEVLIYNKNNKLNNRNRKIGLIKRANKKPDLEPHSKYNLSNALKKIKNKSVEKKAKDLFSVDKKETNNEKEKNKFIKKLKEIEVKIEGINELKKTKQKEENKIEFKNNNKENNDKDNFINFNFDIKMQSGNSENKYQELKKLYFSGNKFDFTSLHKKNVKENNRNNNKDSNNKIKNFTNSYKNYIDFKDIYKKSQKTKNSKKNQNMIRIINKSDNFKNILNKIENLEENKNDNIFLNNYLLNKNKTLNDLNRNRNITKKSNYDFFKSVSLEKSSKFKNMMDDVYTEIKDINNYSLKRNFNNKISNIKANINYTTLFRREKKFDIIKNSLINQCDYNKSNNLNFDDLLNLCSKRNLKFLTKNSKIIF